MVTTENRKVTADAGKMSLLDIFDPGSERPNGDVVFLLAGHRAGVATDAPVLVDNETVTHSTQRLRGVLPFVGGNFPTFSLGEIQRIAFRVSKAKLRKGAILRARLYRNHLLQGVHRGC